MPLGRVLVVEDEPQVADMLAAALTSLGYESQSASNGPDALRLAPLYQPDVVLLDVLMPGMPGTEVLDALRRDYPDVPVVMVTAMQDEDNPANVRLRRAPSRPAPWGSIAHGVGRAAGSHRRARAPARPHLPGSPSPGHGGGGCATRPGLSPRREPLARWRGGVATPAPLFSAPAPGGAHAVSVC